MALTHLRTIYGHSLLIARCFFRFLYSGKANKKISSPTSVVIIQRGKFGDMIVTTSMFRAVKRVYPNCQVTVIGDAVNKQVIDGNPDINKYIIWDDAMETIISQIKAGSYDFGCITGPNFHSLAALYLGGVRAISAPYITNGWSPYETKSYKLVRNFVIKKEHRMKHYVPREFLRLLEPIGIFTDDTKKYIYWSKEGEEKAKKIISKVSQPFSYLVGVIPGAGNKVKQWPPKRFAEVADYLIDKYDAYILVIGSEREREEIEEMVNDVSHKDRVEDTIGTSIDEVKALISKLDFTVSVDTGLVFIAQAGGVPTVDIAGSIHPNEMAPNDGKFHLLVTSLGEPEIWTMNARILNYERAREQIESITVSMVTEKVDELILKIKNSRK